MKRNYKRIYRSLHMAMHCENWSPNKVMQVFRIAKEQNWSDTPFIHRKIVEARKCARS